MTRKRNAGRPVDRAMDAERPEKATIRRLWANVIRAASERAQTTRATLYLTLCGAQGRDIEMLINDGVVSVTETGALSAESLNRVVAVERNQEALLALQSRFPGLRIRGNLAELLHGESPIRFPTGDDVDFCRAPVVNLDLDEVFDGREDDQGILFPLLVHIRKLSQIHAVPPRIEWHLCLTLHGEIRWSEAVCNDIKDFLLENFQQDGDFATAANRFLGEALFNEIVSTNVVRFDGLDREDQQKVLMIVVPKKIARFVNPDGWRVTTLHNFRYGGTTERAPMVSWILHFQSDNRASRRPQAVYVESLRSILHSPSHINEAGRIVV